MRERQKTYKEAPILLFLAHMRKLRSQYFLTTIILCLLQACANIVPPSGGDKDVTPPRLVSVSPADSLLNTRVTEIEMKFDEFVVVNNPASEVTISPILPFPLNIDVVKRTVRVRIPDSLLQSNTTYRINFGKAIQDLHEGNPFTGYSYIFSTGNYFDSLQLNGSVYNAATGSRDTGALVLLYDAVKPDSAVMREKPLYVVKADVGGNFKFEGLPDRKFNIYALRDGNNNMVYDRGEMIGFLDTVVTPSNVNRTPIRLNMFVAEDTSGAPVAAAGRSGLRQKQPGAPAAKAEGFSYTLNADTADTRKRTFDLTKPLEITFSKPIATVTESRIHLSYDSSGITIESGFQRLADTAKKNVIRLNTNWRENMLYTIRLLKGFAQDTAGTEAMPSRYSFRTRRDDDYAKLSIHLPSRYQGGGHIFVLLSGGDTIYHRPVADTMIRFTKLQPGSYTMNVIIDRNRNGRWDTGDLLGRRQPEEVIPYSVPINLKAGWDNMIDFEQKENDKKRR
jgi:hypothetical protein